MGINNGRTNKKTWRLRIENMEDKANGYFKYAVGFTVLLAFLIIIYALAFRVVSESNKEIFIHTIGIVEGSVLTLIGYYFGTSSSSKAKDVTIAKELDKK